jgi:transposase
VGIELNPGPPRLTDYERWKIVILDEQKKKKVSIAREVKCNPDTVTDVLNRFKETGTVDNKPRPGRKRKLSREQERKVVKKARQRKSATKIAQEMKSEGKSISERSVRRTLKKEEFFFLPPRKVQRLTKAQKKKRANYAKDMLNANWKDVLFTDEKSFWLGQPSDWCWQQLDDRIEEELEQETPKLHVWGSIGYYFKTDLYFFEENLNAKLYQSIVSKRLPPNHFASDCPESYKQKWYFLQDNDPKHKAKASMKLLKELTKNRMYQHPPKSPDFNVMEDVWSYLDRHVRASKVKTIEGLKRKLTKLWNELSWTEFRPSIDSMPDRLRQALQRRGGRTDY